MGNIVSFSDSVMGTWNDTYDTLNRIASATAIAGSYSSAALSWTIDPFGNRTAQTVSGHPTPPMPQSWSATISSSSGSNWTYDAAGDVTSDGSNDYLYDGAGRLCAVENLQSGPPYAMTGYLYDGNGNRIAKGSLTSFSCNLTSNGFAETTSYVVDKDGEQLTELQGSTPVHTNVFAGGKLLATYSNSQVYFGFTDWLGTKRAEVASNCTSTYASLPYGDELTPSGNCPDATEHHYTGKERDSESGNDYFGARYYASTMGRFLSPDWSKNPEPVPYADFGNPQSLNLYTYAGNNPLIHIDADGHCWPQWLCNFVIETKNKIFHGEFTTDTAGAEIRQLDRQEAKTRQYDRMMEEMKQHPPQIEIGIVFPIGIEGLGGLTAEEAPGLQTRTDPSTPIGRRGNPIDVKPGTNTPELINGRKFTGHALDQMQGRGIPSSVVEEVITNGTPGPGNDPGTFTHTGDGVQVVTNSTGDVVTVKTVSR